jgi:hypothetical protein
MERTTLNLFSPNPNPAKPLPLPVGKTTNGSSTSSISSKTNSQTTPTTNPTPTTNISAPTKSLLEVINDTSDTLTAVKSQGNSLYLLLTQIAKKLDVNYMEIEAMSSVVDDINNIVYSEANPGSITPDSSPFVADKFGSLASDPNAVPGGLGVAIDADVADAQLNGLGTGFDNDTQDAIFRVLKVMNFESGFPVGFSFNNLVQLTIKDVSSMVPRIYAILNGNYDQDTYGSIYLPMVALAVKGTLFTKYKIAFPTINV